jgi:ElaB/YqjD/DUF883 family membrane-anchored ribosome-binding protein
MAEGAAQRDASAEKAQPQVQRVIDTAEKVLDDLNAASADKLTAARLLLDAIAIQRP